MTIPILTAELTAQNLYIGKALTRISIERDLTWPNMWRVRQANGAGRHRGSDAPLETNDFLSDITNLTRAKDAAIAMARPKGLGGGEIVRWHRRERRAGGASMRWNRRAA
jgi:hypothetical protein